MLFSTDEMNLFADKNEFGPIESKEVSDLKRFDLGCFCCNPENFCLMFLEKV